MKMTTLANLHPGENGVIQAVHAEESLFQRLSALGFRTGKKIELIRRANFDGPLHVRIGSTEVVLRESEARRIQITH